MKYEINEEESMILKMVDDICTDVVSRRAAEIDEQDEFPEDIYRLFVEPVSYTHLDVYKRQAPSIPWSNSRMAA